MSTVVVTPTHIASDHGVVRMGYPHHTIVDIHYRKLFVDPDKKFIVGSVGEFIPEQLDTLEFYENIEFLLAEIMLQTNMIGLGFDLMLPIQTDITEFLEKYLDKLGRTFLVTKKYRFIYFYNKTQKTWCTKRLEDYAGIGSGGMVATGLLLGGLPLSKIWEPLHHLDKVSSIEHTTIPLSSLRSWDVTLESIRKAKKS